MQHDGRKGSAYHLVDSCRFLSRSLDLFAATIPYGIPPMVTFVGSVLERVGNEINLYRYQFTRSASDITNKVQEEHLVYFKHSMVQE